MTTTPDANVKHGVIAILGLLSIIAYGGWYYSFGVLLDPIVESTGWSESTLASGFALGSVGLGLAAIPGGRLIDRFGTTVPFIATGLIGGVGFTVASFADTVSLFVVSSAIAMTVVGGVGFYHATMAAAIRTHPKTSERAISELTIWGAFASVLALPLVAWLVDGWGWRATVRGIGASVAFAFIAAGLLIRVPPADGNFERPPMRMVLASVVNSPIRRRFTFAAAFAGIAIATILVYQVPVMLAAGLSAGTASVMAGLRGFAQLGGRLPLPVLLRRFGSTGTLMLAFAAMGIGGLVLPLSGSIAVAGVFALTAGFGVGAHSPLQGIKTNELYDSGSIGATMGIYSAVLAFVGAAGPALAGMISEQTGERRWAVLLVVIPISIAFALLVSMRNLEHSGAADTPTTVPPARCRPPL